MNYCYKRKHFRYLTAEAIYFIMSDLLLIYSHPQKFHKITPMGDLEKLLKQIENIRNL